MQLWQRVREQGLRPVDPASLGAFRALFGAVMFVSVVRYTAKGWITSQLTSPAFHFTYAQFAFVRPLSDGGMTALFFGLAVAALGITFGLWCRLSTAGFLLGFSYIELIDRATYLNHYYLVSLLAALLTILPAGAAFSLDARRKLDSRASTVPAWTLFALRFQVGVVYFFAGVAKLNPDWLLRAQPLRMWLGGRSDVPVIGPLLAEPFTAHAASLAGAAFDLGIVWMLLIPRTRTIAVIAAIAFHAATGLLFPIGIFPFLMTAGVTLFLPADWPRRLLPARLVRRPAGPCVSVPSWVAALVLVHCVVQLVLPLRGFLGQESSAWTLRGFNFSWKVMIAEKSGVVSYEVRDKPTGERTRVEPASYLTAAQERAMAQDPEMIRALARHIAASVAHGKDDGRVEVFADAFASLNGRPVQRLVDPNVDLTKDAPFVLPLADDP